MIFFILNEVYLRTFHIVSTINFNTTEAMAALSILNTGNLDANRLSESYISGFQSRKLCDIAVS